MGYFLPLLARRIMRRFQPSAVRSFLGGEGLSRSGAGFSLTAAGLGFSGAAFLGFSALGFLLKNRVIINMPILEEIAKLHPGPNARF